MRLLFGFVKLAASSDSSSFQLTNQTETFRIWIWEPTRQAKFTSRLGETELRGCECERLGIERIREIARENGKKGGRPPKKGEPNECL